MAAVFAQAFNNQAHVFQVTHTGFRLCQHVRMPEPKALRMTSHQGRRALAQFHRGRRGRRQFAQFIVLGSHETNVRTIPAQGKKSLPLS
jgi:hypothetical protein